MMELTKKNVEEYICRFMDGETDNAEEKALYRFFREGDVPEHLKEYAPMFAWYEGGMQGEPGRAAEVPKRRKKLSSFRVPVVVWSAGIAAMIVVALGLGILLYSDKGQDMNAGEWACYEGSYIEVGGKRFTDIKQILPLILEEQTVAEQKERLAEQRIREMEKKEKRVREKVQMANSK